MLHSPTSQIHLNMQLVQVYSVLMCCLETNSDAVFCRWKFCHSQLVKEDGSLLICQTDFKRILYTELGQMCSNSETHLVVTNLLHPCLMPCPEEGNCLRADFAPSLARAIHRGDAHGEVGPSRLAWSRGQRVRLCRSELIVRSRVSNPPGQVSVLCSSRQRWSSRGRIFA